MLRNVGSNWFLLVVTVLATYFLVPFNLHHLGEEQYGLWLLIASLTAYLSLLQLGVPMASVRHMAKAVALGDTPELNRLVASCAGLYLGLGAFAALLGIPLLLFYESAYTIRPEWQAEARYAFLLALLNVLCGFVAQLPYAIMHSYQDFVRKNVLATLMVFFRVGLNVALVLWLPSLLMIAAVQLAVTLVEMTLMWTVILVSHPSIRPTPALFSLAKVREVFGFSVYVLLLSLGSQLSFQTDALVIGRFVGERTVPVFAVGNNLILYLMQFVVGISEVVMPMAISLQERGRMEELRVLFFRWSKLAIALTWCAGVYFVVFGPDFVANWVGPEFRDRSGSVLRILMLSYFVFLPVRGVGVPILMGTGRAARPTVAFLAAGVVNLLLSLLLVRWFGLDGVAWGTTIPNLMLTAALLGLVCRAVGVPIASYLRATLPRAIVGFVPVFLFAWAWRQAWQPRSLFDLGVAGVVTLGAFGLVWVAFVLRNDPHVELPAFGRLLARRTG
jgi:O-antigen/teichoic acid export membrane protein